MTFQITHQDDNARVGQLKTAHGIIETPFYMPCATKATGKYITTDDYQNIGENTSLKAVIANAFLLSCKPGIETVQKAGGLHKFMNYSGIIFTDCGGFQVSRSMYEKKSKEGLCFRNPFNQSQIHLTPQKIMEIEIALGSDVAMMLDDMSLFGISEQEAEIAMENTHRWGRESLEHHHKLKAEKKSSQLLFGIVQGNFYPNLRKKSAQFISSLPFDGIAIGGLAIGEPKDKMYEAANAALPFIPKEKPRYVMGVGSPEDVLELIGLGVDCFDSVYPTQIARHHGLFTFKGKIDIAKIVYTHDFTPIEDGCLCHTCLFYSKAYLNHLVKIQEPVANRLCSIHNLYFMQKLIEKTKQAIKEKRFAAFKEDFIKNFKPIKGGL